MIHCIQTMMHRRQRRCRAMIIQNELASAGYSARDLTRLAQLRASVDPGLVVATPTPEPLDPTQPMLADVLQEWERGYPPVGWGIPQTTTYVDEVELMAIRL